MKQIRTSLRRRELEERWVELATELGLDPGERATLEAAGFPPGEPWRRVPVETCEAVLDELEASSRRRRPFLRIEAHALVVDLDAAAHQPADELRAVVEVFLGKAIAVHQAHIVADVEARRGDGLTYARLARRWGVGSATTLRRWREAESDRVLVVGAPKQPGNGASELGIVAQDGRRPARPERPRRPAGSPRAGRAA